MLRPSSRRARRSRKASSRYERLETRQLLTASNPLQFETDASTSFMNVEGEPVEVTLASNAEGTTSVSGWLQSAQGTPMAGVPVELGGQTVVTDEAGFFIFQFEPHQIPMASFSIPVPAGDPWFDPFNTGTQSISMQRAVYGAPSESGTQQHPNLITSFIDASMVYGSDDVRAAALRSGVRGKLKVSTGDLLPVNDSDTFPSGPLENDNSGPSDPSTLFVAGDVRANENVGLLSLHTLLVREHNRLADQLAAEDPGLTDEQLYQQARRFVGAMVQHITYNEYLPVLLGEDALPTYAGYDPNVDPAISGLFSGAAFRVGHTQLIPNFQRLDSNNQPLPGGELPLRFAFFNSAAVKSDGIEPYLRGLYATQMQEIDPYVIDDVRNFLFGPPGSGGMDLASINIQRGRDMGLPSYNQARLDFGLPAVTSFAEISSDPVIAAALASVYDNVDQVDVWVGGLAEDHAAGSQVGPLFHRIIADQFARSRDGDRYWFENRQFTSDELSLIRGTSLANLIQRNSTATGFSGNAFTSGIAPSGPSAAGSVATESSTDYRTIDGHGNNPLDPTAGATYDYLATNYTPDYADGVSHPAGDDRSGAREISNAVIAQEQSIANSAGTTGLFIFWGQLLDHDLGLTPGGTSATLTIHGDHWIDPSGYQQYEATSMPVGHMLGSEVAAGGENQSALPITMLSTNTEKRNVFAHLDGEIDAPGNSVDFNISLTPEEFQMYTTQAVVGWKVVAEDGSQLDPAAVQIYDQHGSLIPMRLVQQDAAGGTSSYVMADMSLGDYRVTVTSQNDTVGAFHIEASMVGDFDGDRRAGALDILQILDTIGSGTQEENLHLDLNQDGSVDQADVELGITNFRNRTTLSPMHFSAEIDPASTSGALEEGTVTTSHVTFRGQTVPGMTLHFDTNSDGIIEETITAGALSGSFNFAHNIQLYEGSHEVTITATDRFGQSAEIRFPLTRDANAPHVVSTTPDSGGFLVDASSANTQVTMTFNEALPSAELIQAITVEGDQSGTLTPMNFAWDAPLNRLSFELAGSLPDSSFQVHLATAGITDAVGNPLAAYDFSFTRDRLPKIAITSPASGDTLVPLSQEVVIRFAQPIDPITVTTETVTALAGSQPVSGSLVVSSTGQFATFFPDNPWPASTEVRVAIDGDHILTPSGDPIDADGDHTAGGVGIVSFRTLSVARIQNTDVVGVVRDSATGAPLVGATIRVDGLPDVNVVTDADGQFELTDMPAYGIFVHIDGSTATHVNLGGTLAPIDSQAVGYPSIGQTVATVPGQTESFHGHSESLDVFLAAIPVADTQALSPTETTEVGFGDEAKGRLTEMLPDVDPAIFDQAKVSFAPGTAVDNTSSAATQAVLVPLAADHAPAPLPPGLTPQLVVSVQAEGATYFDVPAAVTLPNLEGLAPGEKAFIYSFDAGAGAWKIVGTATVTPDGKLIESDGGVLQAPGWHFVHSGTQLVGNVYANLDGISPQPAYYVAEPDIGSGPVIRGVTNDVGQLALSLPANTQYTIKLLGTSLQQTGQFTITTGGSGTSIRRDFVLADDSTSQDTDSDGISDLSEYVLGTSSAHADTDLDGITDLAELQQHLDPLDARAFPTGIVASLPLLGEAKGIVLADPAVNEPQTAYVATGSDGLAIVDVSRFAQPILLGQLSLPGNAVDIAVNANQSLAVIAATGAGLHIVDISDPLLPTLLQTITAVDVKHVEIFDDVLYAAVGSVIQSHDLSTGQLLARVDYGDAITGIAREGRFLVSMHADNTLRITELSAMNLSPRGSLELTAGGGNVFVGGGVVYATASGTATGGFSTVDISDPGQPVLISDSDVTDPLVAPQTAILAGGSGLGFLLGSSGTGSHVVDVIDLTDLTNTNAAGVTLLTRYELPSMPHSAVISSGIGLIATGTAGLQVVNYAQFDTQGVAPTLTLDTDAIDIDSVTPGLQVVEGSSLPLSFTISDDVQVSRVQLLVNGVVQQTDASFPFDMTAVFPSRLSGTTATLELRVTDTGGNVTTTGELSVSLLPDLVAPEVTLVTPADQSQQFAGLQNIRVQFNEPLATGRLVPEHFQLYSLDNPSTPIPLTGLQILQSGAEVSLTFDPLPAGEYELRLDAAALTDWGWNPIGAGLHVTSFTVIENSEPSRHISSGTDLGVLGADTRFLHERIGRDDLGNADTGDVYWFTLAHDQTVNFDFFGQTQPYDVVLYIYADNYERLEEWEITTPTAFTESLPAGEYFLMITPESGSTDTPYSIGLTAPPIVGSQDTGDTIATATDLGTATEVPAVASDIVVPGDMDFYRFDLATGSDVQIDFTNIDEALFVRLFEDRNNNGQMEISERLHTTARNVPFTLSEPLSAGRYYFYVFGSDSNTPYELSLTATEIVGYQDAGNDLPTARDLGTISQTPTEAVDVVQTGDVDYYRFELATGSDFTAQLSDIDERMQVQLFQDLNGNQQLDASEVLIDSHAMWTTWINEPLSAGIYYLAISNNGELDWEDNTKYRLALSATEIVGSQDTGDDVLTAHNLGMLTETPTEAIDIAQTGDTDIYRFDLAAHSTLSVELANLIDYVTLRVYSDFNSNNVLESHETLESASAYNVFQMQTPLSSGTYYLEIVPRSNEVYDNNTSYLLSVSATSIPGSQDAGNSLASAHDLGTLSASDVIVSDVIQTGDVDYYRFTLAEVSTIDARFTGLSERARFTLLRDFDGNMQADYTDAMASGDDYSQFSFNESLPPGVYYLSVLPFSELDALDNTAYTLAINAQPIAGSVDAGDTRATATDLGTLGQVPIDAVDIAITGDTDWYRFEVATDAYVTASFVSLGNSVTYTVVHDVNGNDVIDAEDYIDTADVLTASTHVEPLPGGVYFLLIQPLSQGGTAVSSAYHLQLSAAPIADPVDAGDNLGSAVDLGELDAVGTQHSGIIHTTDVDVFRFSLASPSIVNTLITGLSEAMVFQIGQDLNMSGTLEADEFLEDAIGNSAVIFDSGLDAGDYYVAITPYSTTHSGNNTAYTFQLTAEAIPGAVDAGGDVATALDLGSIDSSSQSAADVVQFDDVDIFQFTLSASADVILTLSDFSERVYAGLYIDRDGDQLLEPGEYIHYHTGFSGTAEWDHTLSAGTYYVLIKVVSTANDRDNTAYHLSVGKTASGLLQGEPDWNPSAVDQALEDEDLFDPMAA